MCGITGFVDFASLRSPADNRKLAEMMAEALKHRGPDGGGVWGTENVWLSFRRLAVVDLTRAGNQPMVLPDGLGALIFNGEAYNAERLNPNLKHAAINFGAMQILKWSFMLAGNGASPKQRDGLSGCSRSLIGMAETRP